MIASVNSEKYRSDMRKYCNIHFVIIAAFYSFFFFFADFGISFNIAVIIIFSLLIAATLLKLSLPLKFQSKQLAFILIAVVLAIILNIRDISYLSSNPMYLFTMLTVAFSFAFIEPDLKSKDTILNIVLVPSVLSLIIVYLSTLLPSFYLNYIASIFSPAAYTEIEILMNKGYSGSMGGNISLTANYLVLGMAICVGRYIYKHKRRYLLSIALFLVALLFVNRRSELLAAVGALAVVIYCVSSKKIRAYLTAFLLILIVLGTLFVLCVKLGNVTYSGDNRILISLFEFLHGKDISNGRLGLYKLAWELFCEKPVFGIGWGQFRNYGRKQLTQITNVHNIYLQLLCETGVVGTVIILGAIIYVTAKIFKNFKESKGLVSEKFTAFSLFAIIYILILGFFDNPIFQDSIWLLFGVIIVCSFRNVKEKKYNRAGR